MRVEDSNIMCMRILYLLRKFGEKGNHQSGRHQVFQLPHDLAKCIKFADAILVPCSYCYLSINVR